uniref:Endonuclease III domain-containing protein n=1 Tax=Caldimicrobium thiodismutans TaxID=1653476 RepID=A0A832LUJ3_9BACT
MKAKVLREIYHRLYTHFGPQGWWPAETPFEVCIGAILTQNTNWQNVERAISKLKERDLLNPQKLYEISERELAELIRPSGYYNVKAKRLKNFISFLVEKYGGDLEVMKRTDLHTLREKLLKIKGLGPETVDSILLYALEKPVFVIDAYTYRILFRHSLIPEEVTYEELQELFHSALEEDVELFKEYHALLVACGKTYCKKSNPLCEPCPLAELK